MARLTRRQTLGAAGAGGAALIVGQAGLRSLERAGSLVSGDQALAAGINCSLTPAETEGPYFVDERLNRSEITTDPANPSSTAQDGLPLTLTINVLRLDDDCAPEEGAQVDVWHANADGHYSDVSQNSTVGQKWLRGYQLTDENGSVTFSTIFPGWYSGRTIHIHFKVRTFNGSSETYEFTSQIFFAQSVIDAVYSQNSDYSSNGTGDVTNSEDGIFDSSLVMAVSGGPTTAYAGTFNVGLNGLPDAGGSTRVKAALASARFTRTAGGKRVLKLRVNASERVSADARLLRDGELLARKRAAKLKPGGIRILRIPLGAKVKGGPARLKLILKDTAGNSKTAKRTLRIPRRG
jgi:protocatechuate 3,4-dioxygenase beta subunit